MQFEHLLISSLKSLPKNARKHSKRNIDVIKKSLQECGQQKPIVIDANNVVIAGNGTLESAKSLGWDKIWVTRTSLDKSRAELFAILDNRTAELAEWDADELTDALDELDKQGWELEDFGWDDKEREKFRKQESKEGLTDDDEVPEQVETRCKLGDLWLLGDHRLVCGDSTDVLQVERLMHGEKADMVFTDPPYNMAAEGGSLQPIGRAAAKLGERIKHLCDFEPEAFLNVLPVVFSNGKMNAYVFCNKDLVPQYLNWGVKAGYNFNILFWKKPNAIPLGGNHRPDVEYLLLFRKSAIWNNAVEGVSYSRCLEFPRELSKDHPTLKPVELISNEVLISSNLGGIVVEFFLGSGSTLIACEKTGRKCYGMEIDPHYCDVIITRWEKFTGKTALRADGGEICH